MNRSESIVNLSKALLKFQNEVNKISKDSDNPFFKSKYASLSNILSEIDETLSMCGLVLIQPPTKSEQLNAVCLSTLLIHAESGEYIESTFSMIPAKSDPQGFGSCITYMRRYAITSILKLNVDEDDDGNHASAVKSRASDLNNKLNAKKSEVFHDIKNKLSIATSKGELDECVKIINSQIKSDLEKKELRREYSIAQDRIENHTGE